MNKILITGVAGFLGSNLAKKLLEDDNNLIFGLDNLAYSKMTNIYPLLKSDRFNFIEANLLSDNITHFCDCVYHMAGCGDDSAYFDNKYDFTIDTIKITNNILNYASSCGSKIIIPVSYVDYSPHNNQFFIKYDTSRLIQDLVQEYSINHHLDCKIAKITTGYGENMNNDDNRFISKTIISAFNNETIKIDYDRSDYFTFSADITNALIAIMNTYCDRNVIEISQPNLHLKSDIAKLIINFTKSKSQLKILNQEIYHPSYKPNIQTLNNEINFRCSVPILEGMNRTINYFKKIYFS
ncbi:MAG: NAD-dependent epimerase/dehydratase family protein [Candidatus Gastranaerophilales bacterium]|nr:NAD-dependent epimerase/dehydratase family protein [Candidatus Gastranaerophilales bacterium]